MILRRSEKPFSLRVNWEIKKFESKFPKVLATTSQKISGPSLAAIKAGGKRLRPALVIISSHLGKKADRKKLFNACAAVELVHLASLVHDDVLDGSDTRRGISTINANYGKERAVIIGDYLFGLAFRLLARCDDNSLIEPLAGASILLSQGELQQRQMLRRLDQPVDDYIKRIYTKTAALFVAACVMGSRAAGLKEEISETLKEYAGGLGIAFQIYDDILDFTGDESVLGKPVGSDIREGTVTLPMIYALKTNGSVLSRAISHPDDDLVNQAVDHVIECGAIDKAKSMAKKYVERANNAADRLPYCMGRNDLVSLGNFVIDRYH